MEKETDKESTLENENIDTTDMPDLESEESPAERRKQQGQGLKILTPNHSQTSEPHRFKLDLTDKPNLKNPNKNMALANLRIFTLGKTSSQNTTTINLKFWLQLGMILLIYLMVLTQFLIFKIILNLSLKNMKL